MKTLTPALSLFPKGEGEIIGAVSFNHKTVNPFRDWIKFSLSWEERAGVRPSVSLS